MADLHGRPLPTRPRSPLSAARSATLALAALTVLTSVGCSLSDDEPLAPGAFELVVTGDVEARLAGTTSYVAAPDSGLNVTDNEWTVGIPIVFESDLDGGDQAEVSLTVGEPTSPNGPFTELPEGTLVVGQAGEYDPTVPIVVGTIRTEMLALSPTDGTLRLRRTADGVEGQMEARYSAAQFNGDVFRGRVRLRLYALAGPPER